MASSFLPGRGGIESYLADLTHHVSPRLAVLAQQERDGRQMPSDLDYPVSTMPTKLRPNKELADKILRTARNHGTNKVLFGSAWPLPLIAPTLRRKGLEYAIIVHGAELFIPARIPIARSRLRKALLGADTLFAVSAYTERRLRQFLSRPSKVESFDSEPDIRRMRVIVDTKRFNPTARPSELLADAVPEGAQIVLHVGRLVKRKGIHRLISAFPTIMETNPQAILVIAGCGPEERGLRALAEKQHIPAIFLGSVSEADIPALYAAADIFVLPVADRWFGLEFEGLGIVLLEAAACETPSVVGRSGGTAEAVIDDVTGFVIDGNDSSQLIEKVAALLSDDHLRLTMGQAARDYVKQGFSATESQTALLAWLKS